MKVSKNLLLLLGCVTCLSHAKEVVETNINEPNHQFLYHIIDFRGVQDFDKKLWLNKNKYMLIYNNESSTSQSVDVYIEKDTATGYRTFNMLIPYKLYINNSEVSDSVLYARCPVTKEVKSKIEEGNSLEGFITKNVKTLKYEVLLNGFYSFLGDPKVKIPIINKDDPKYLEDTEQGRISRKLSLMCLNSEVIYWKYMLDEANRNLLIKRFQ